MSDTKLTPSQTVGPYFIIGLRWDDGKFVVPEHTEGAFTIRGFVLDGDGDPVPDTMVESWQADPDGRFAHPDDPRGVADWNGFRGFGRVPVSEDGEYEILTVKPGTFPDADGKTEAPHINLNIACRGMLKYVPTRLYFEDEAEANAADPVLAKVPEGRRETLIANKTEDGYRLDIHLQGPQETVFFDI